MTSTAITTIDAGADPSKDRQGGSRSGRASASPRPAEATPVAGLRVVRAPVSEPAPYQPGHRPNRHLRVVRPRAEQLRLDLQPERRYRHAPRPDADFGRQHTAEAELPDLDRFAVAFCRAAAEVLTGHRKVEQLHAHGAPGVLRWLDDNRAVPDRDGRLPSPPRVRSVSVCRVRDGVAEVTALVQRGPRTKAMTVRLIGLDRRWQCVHLGVV